MQGQPIVQIDPLQADARVGQREEWHDTERHPRMQPGLNALDRRQHFPLGLPELLQGFGHGLWAIARRGKSIHQFLERPPDGFQWLFLGGPGADRRHQAEYHTSQGRMHAGLQQSEPDNSPRQQVRIRLADAHPLKHQHQQQAPGRDHQAQVIQAGGIEEGNDQDSDDVIDNGQGQQQDPHAAWNRLAQQGQDAHGKGNVRGGGDGPAVGRRGAVVEQGVDDRWHQHTAQGRAQGQGRQLQVGQCPVLDLLADFSPHHQEEDGHQSIVDQKVQ